MIELRRINLHLIVVADSLLAKNSSMNKHIILFFLCLFFINNRIFINKSECVIPKCLLGNFSRITKKSFKNKIL